MRSYFLLIVFLIIFMLNPVRSEETDMTHKQKLSYALGVFFAQSVSQQNIDMDVDQFLAAVSDILNNNPPKLSIEEIQTIFAEFQQQEQQNRARLAAVNSESGKAFLKQNREREGVVELDNGLQYKILRPGSGPTPEAGGEVTVHYRGKLINGTEFDSSYQRNEPAKTVPEPGHQGLAACAAADENRRAMGTVYPIGTCLRQRWTGGNRAG